MHVKVDATRLPVPRLPPTRPVRVDFYRPPHREGFARDETVDTWCGIQRKTGPYTDAEDDLILALWAEGATYHMIANRLNRYTGSVRSHIHMMLKDLEGV